jgi:quercetin dioxygenase-like cupin family protein
MRVIATLADEVAITPDSTLSKVVVKDGPVRLVLFAFDQGQELTEHSASVPVIVQVVSGSLTISVGGETHRLTPESWLYVDAGEPHTVVADTPARMLLTMIRCP